MPRKQSPSQALKTLESLGYEVPTSLVEFTELSRYEQEGIEQVWKCKACDATYEAETKILEGYCHCGGTMKMVWP